MYVKERIKNHFLNLLEDKTLAMVYFQNRDIIGEFNYDKFVELDKKTKKNENKFDLLLSLLSAMQTLRIDGISRELISKLNKHDYIYTKSLNEFDLFKSNLAYLIISGVIKMEDIDVLGYDKDFIDKFLKPYKKQLKNSYNEYYYNEKTGTTTLVSEDKSLILPYTPYAVRKQIEEETYLKGEKTPQKKLKLR